MKTPNHEQALAINHDGGVILKAGAGSGKTFVLVEHAIDLTRKQLALWKRSDRSHEWEDTIIRFYSQTVFMTFTKLAAGEIGVRLYNRFKQQVEHEENDDQLYWEAALRGLDRLNVTTIDGFCYKLVRRGYFPSLSLDSAIVDQDVVVRKIRQLIDVWATTYLDEKPIIHEFLRNRDRVVENLVKIFSDPSLRLLWKEFFPESMNPSKQDDWLSEFSKLYQWQEFIALDIPAVPEDKKKNKWAQFLALWQGRLAPLTSWKEVVEYAEFFKGEGKFTSPQKRHVEAEVHQYFLHLKEFKTGVSLLAEMWVKYEESYAVTGRDFIQLFYELYHFLDKELVPDDGMTFGDLEYQVLLALSHPDVALKVREDFQYFVVDEFQDTSRVQWDIIRYLTGEDWQRLFCVGDAKQAIYGFRGGELQVFQECAKVTKPLFLNNNYRSLPDVIKFNNSFFSWLFPLSKELDSADLFTVEVEPQNIPEEKSYESSGDVFIHQIDLADLVEPDEESKTDKVKAPPSELNNWENMAILQLLSDRLLKQEGKVAILYKKLAPSLGLIDELMTKNIGFTASLKVQYQDDPLMGISLCLLEYVEAVEPEKGLAWAILMTKAYFQLLKLTPPSRLEQLIEQFRSDIPVLGLKIAFKKFFQGLRLSSAYPQGSLAHLDKMIDLNEAMPSLVRKALERESEAKYDIDFQFGPNPHKLRILTAHGSKGLEFDYVIVGGLYTNAKNYPDDSIIRGLPGAIQWPDPVNRNKRIGTPTFILDKLLSEKKEFSESKRLFYVACTRAQKELHLIQFMATHGEFNPMKKSWGSFVSAWGEVNDGQLKYATPKLVLSQKVNEISGKPVFHKFPLGISQCQGAVLSQGFGMTSELSVTRLATIVECPRKFWFKHIVKLPEKFELESDKTQILEENDEVKVVSSAERGTFFHAILSEAIKHNFVIPREHWEHSEKHKWEWALTEIKKMIGPLSVVLSEEQIKFSFFQFMMTGIPDLVLLNCQQGHHEIWDFKTGKRSQGKELNYWFQLKCYAWALWSTQKVPQDAHFLLKLCYLDTQEIPTRELSYRPAKDELFSQWSKLASLQEINRDHCSACQYSEICPRD